MPVIITAADYGHWINPEFYDPEQLQRMIQAVYPWR
jgi:hypothetical protein